MFVCMWNCFLFMYEALWIPATQLELVNLSLVREVLCVCGLFGKQLLGGGRRSSVPADM